MPEPRGLLFINKVLGDGLGDLGHLIDIASPDIIRSTFPSHDDAGHPLSYSPNYIIILDNPTPNRLRFVLNTLIENNMIKYVGRLDDAKEDDQLLACFRAIERNNPHLCLRSSAMSDFNTREALAIGSIKGFSPNVANPAALYVISCEDKETDALQGVIEDKYPKCSCTIILEHGRFARVNRTPKLSYFDHTVHMGLYEREDGILLKPSPKITTYEKAVILKQMQNQVFANTLTGLDVKNSSLESVQAIMETTLFIPAYWQKGQQSTDYRLLETLLISPLASEYKNIVIYTNKLDESLIDSELLEKHGLHLENFDMSRGTRSLRTLRADQHRLNNQDYANLFKLATHFGGCSGDKTLETVLSNGLIPLYQEPRATKVILDSLIQIANKESVTEDIVYFLKILSHKQDFTPSLLASKLDKLFLEEWHKFIEIIQTKHNLYEKLPAIMRTSLKIYEFYSGHLSSFEENIQNNQYEQALEQLHIAQLDFFDLMRLTKSLSQAYPQAAAFVYQYINAMDMLEKNKNLDRTEVEIEEDENLDCTPKNFKRTQSNALMRNIEKHGFDRINFPELDQKVTLKRKSQSIKANYKELLDKDPINLDGQQPEIDGHCNKHRY